MDGEQNKKIIIEDFEYKREYTKRQPLMEKHILMVTIIDIGHVTLQFLL